MAESAVFLMPGWALSITRILRAESGAVLPVLVSFKGFLFSEEQAQMNSGNNKAKTILKVFLIEIAKVWLGWLNKVCTKLQKIKNIIE